MKNAVFLVTALSDIKKESFGAQLAQLLAADTHVGIILGNLDYAEVATAKWMVNKLVDQTNQVSVTTLAEIFAEDDGIDLAATAIKQVDDSQLTKREFDEPSGMHLTRYLAGDALLKEVRTTPTGTITDITFYQDDQVEQVVYYEQARPVVIANYQDNALQSSSLLNNNGQLVYRFIRHSKPVRRLYNLNKASSLQLTDIREAQPKAPTTEKAQTAARNEMSVVTEQEDYYQVMNYVDFHKYQDIYAFYYHILQKLALDSVNLFINIDHNVEMTATMPHQLIFNY
ncbi:hypothetical protein [Lactiplantibacillus daowaiensis]|uniref:Uncharacterized protein n=1 Tax=Lactiplantibacillus daowaiensis TaxID=2559918 RepID=A0ABW1RWV2_9LACO|nr:hypothetical protein [Lactiplantibacillus daowaiensis]